MRALPFLAAIVLGLTPGSSDIETRARLGAVARISAVRVPLDAGDPRRVRVGALTYLGGVRLESPDPAFGGFSAMRVAGDAFTLVSDSGNVVRFRMGADWRVRDAAFGDLPGGPGTGFYKWQRDSESLAWDPASGRVWVGFERFNAIWRFDSGLTRAERAARPAAMRKWPWNGGPESLARLPDGGFVAISETARPHGGAGREALRFAGDPTGSKAAPTRFVFVPPEGYDPSDAAALPDGRLLVLTRRLALRGLFTAKIVLVDPRGVTSGAVLRGAEIATLAAPLLHDNFEAIAVTKEGADTIVWLATDDNQEFWEASLLLKFRLEYGQAKSPPSAGRTGSR